MVGDEKDDTDGVALGPSSKGRRRRVHETQVELCMRSRPTSNSRMFCDLEERKTEFMQDSRRERGKMLEEYEKTSEGKEATKAYRDCVATLQELVELFDNSTTGIVAQHASLTADEKEALKVMPGGGERGRDVALSDVDRVYDAVIDMVCDAAIELYVSGDMLALVEANGGRHLYLDRFRHGDAEVCRGCQEDKDPPPLTWETYWAVRLCAGYRAAGRPNEPAFFATYDQVSRVVGVPDGNIFVDEVAQVSLAGPAVERTRLARRIRSRARVGGRLHW